MQKTEKMKSGPSAATRTHSGSTVVLTFDDCSRTHFLFAAPILRRYSFGATFYVTGFPLKRPNPEDLGMDGDDLRTLSESGFEIGNHSMNHRVFSRLSEEEIRAEIHGVEHCFAQAGLPPARTFAYPGGPYDPRGAAILKELGYLAARSNEHRYDDPLEDPYRIPAFPVADKYPGIFDEVMTRLSPGRDVLLIYHGLPDAYPPCSTSPGDFERQMQTLSECGVRCVSLLDYVNEKNLHRMENERIVSE